MGLIKIISPSIKKNQQHRSEKSKKSCTLNTSTKFQKIKLTQKNQAESIQKKFHFEL